MGVSLLVWMFAGCGSDPSAPRASFDAAALEGAPVFPAGSPGWLAAVQQDLAALSGRDGVWTARRADGVRVRLDDAGLQVAHGEGALTLGLGGVVPAGGRGRAVLTEPGRSTWIENTPSGVQFGWDAAAPGEADRLLATRSPARVESGDSVVLLDSRGRPWRMDTLRAWDDAGAPLGVRFEAAEGGVHVEVEDAGATFPVHVDPVLAPVVAALTLSGAAGDSLGSAVAVGDVNGDGYADALVGADMSSGGGDGAAYAYLGDVGGLVDVATSTLASPGAGLGFGSAVAWLGDVNGDGYGDVAVAGTGDGAGTVSWYAGSTSGLSAAVAAWSGASGEQLGRSLAGGDFNGDGYQDLAAGGAGFVALYDGSAGGLASSGTLSAIGSYGAALAAGDVNGDGYDDLAVGSPGGDGEVVLHLGSATGLGAGTTWAGSAGSGLGAALALGDTNGDGYADLLAGATGANAAWLAMGSPGGLDDVVAFSGGSGERFGASVGLGDTNGDGYADVAVAGPDASVVRTWHGSSSGPVGDVVADETSPLGGSFGAAMGVGDVNADGYADLVLGAPDSDTGNGSAGVYPGSGAGTRPSVGYLLEGDASSNFGIAVAHAGDLDLDGYADLLVGAPTYGGDTGRAYWFRGGPSGLSSAASATWDGAAAGDLFGTSLAGVGDATGDGWPDVIVGAPAASGAFGAFYLYAGTASGPSATALSSSSGTMTASGFGTQVALAGDVNADGYADAVIGAPYHNSNRGRAFVYHGSATGFPASASTQIGGNSNEYCGFAVGGDVDVNGDGYDDVLVGGYNNNSGYGRARVFHGSASGVPSAATVSIAGSSVISYMGIAMAGVGDVDLDGYDDIAVGAAGDGLTGAVYIYRGSSTGISSSRYDSYAGDTLAGAFGARVAAAGDVNADGYPDFVAGGPYANTNTGYLQLYEGGPSGATATTRVAGEFEGGYFGVAIAGLGDVNGDGYDDIAAGSGYYNGAIGRVYVYPGFVADDDGDGSLSPDDCDDHDAARAPGEAEACDELDNDCDGIVDDGVIPGTWYGDADGDGAGDPADAVTACEAPDGYVATAEDCDPTDGGVYPGAPETCDGVDEDCNGAVDDGATDAATWYADGDADTFGDPAVSTDACAAPVGYVADATDCDDASPAVYPGAPETCDGVDEDCDGAVDDSAIDVTTTYADTDGDGYGDPTAATTACTPPAGNVADATDCDDSRAGVNPGATETCDGVDQDCDGSVDEDAADASAWYADLDLDGYGDPTAVVYACAAPAGYVADASDCDDTTAAVYPGAVEVCDGVDQDCDGTADDAAADAFPSWLDADGDGYGDPASATVDCEVPRGYVLDDQDCDDTDATVNPGAAEICDGEDEDCDGVVDDGATDAATWYADADGDSFGDAATTADACAAPAGYVADASDCDDASAGVYPGAPEICDLLDQDCDGTADDGATDAPTWYADADGDSFGDPASTFIDCAAPAGTVADATDCDDTAAGVYPGATETCDGVDQDCDGAVDDAAVDQATTYADADGDTYGDLASPTTACTPPAGNVTDTTDCDDTRADVNPAGVEVCDGVDQDCDGAVDEAAADATTWYADADGDTWGDDATTVADCAAPAGYVGEGGDCDDTDAAYHPSAPESCTDPADYNCDGSTGYADADADGTAACEDCDDTDATRAPTLAEACDDVDNDCDGVVDDGAPGTATWYGDADGDGFGDASVTLEECAAPGGYTDNPDDCYDTDAAINPDAAEICDGVDNNCDGAIDDAEAVDPATWYADVDGDGYGDATSTAESCAQPGGYVADDTDCDDADAAYHPGAKEDCTDPGDYNCDGSVLYADADADGAPACLDCDDGEPASFPGNPEVCDGLDNDCANGVDDGLGSGTWYVDADGDGYGDPASALTDCTQPEGTIADGTDCDDTDAAAFPGNPEVCDGADNDCDGTADAATFESTSYSICEDSDGDGLLDYDEASQHGTDPYDADTDDGGVDDGTELSNGTDPLDASDDVKQEYQGGCGCGTSAFPSWVGLLAGVLLLRRR